MPLIQDNDILYPLRICVNLVLMDDDGPEKPACFRPEPCDINFTLWPRTLAYVDDPEKPAGDLDH